MQRRVTTILALSILVLFATGSAVLAQDPSWVGLDPGAEPGTPAILTLDEEASSDQDTFLELTIPGFWVNPIVGPDDRVYQQLEFPGLGTIGVFGAPQLPRIRIDLAIPTTAPELLLESLEPLDVHYLPDVLVWPQEIPAREDEDPIPPQFQRDDELYATGGFWPPEVGQAMTPVETRLLTVPSASFELNPCRWDPESGELEVFASLRLHLHHGGAPQGFEEMTRDRFKTCNLMFFNWATVGDHFPFNQAKLLANYAIVAPLAYHSTLAPLVKQKKARGYNVTLIRSFPPDNLCDDIRSQLAIWKNLSPASYDYYVLLVGDTTTGIPMCDSPNLSTGEVVHTDDPYASTSSTSLSDEFWVGRLSVDDTVDLANQIQKILDYENNASSHGNYGAACLVAAKPNPDPYGFDTATWSGFNTAPNFTTHSGSGGATNADVKSTLLSGVGLLVYRGTGIEPAWQFWNTGHEFFNWQDIDDMNLVGKAPVVFSFGPRMGSTRYHTLSPTVDCLGEEWLEYSGGGGVAHYGAGRMPFQFDSDLLLSYLMEFIYDKGVTNLARATAMAEHLLEKNRDGYNAWLYSLLGDPDMLIRRRSPLLWNVETTDLVSICEIAPCNFELRVTDSGIHPIEDLTVSIYKPGSGDGGASLVKRGSSHGRLEWFEVGPNLLQVEDEVLDNRYTDADGRVSIPASPTSEGWLHFVIRDDEGNAHVDSIEVRHGTPASPVSPSQLYLRARPAIMGSRTTFQFGGRLPVAAVLTVYDVRGRRIRRIPVAAGASEASWDGLDGRGAGVASGNYIASMAVGGRRLTARLVKLN